MVESAGEIPERKRAGWGREENNRQSRLHFLSILLSAKFATCVSLSHQKGLNFLKQVGWKKTEKNNTCYEGM